MIDLNDYFYYVHVIDKQGFSAAAKALNIPKSKLSRHVAQLEQRLDIQLIQRTSRHFKITEAGQIFYRHAKALIEEMDAAEAAMQRRKGGLGGQVTLSCSVGVAQFALKNLLIDFLLKYPEINLIQQVTNQPIDMISAGVDLVIRGHSDPLPDSTLMHRHLAEISWHLWASPAYLASYGVIDHPDDLLKQQALKFGWQPASGYWRLQKCKSETEIVTFKPLFCSDDMSSLKQAAIAGMGIVSLPDYVCKDDIASGMLVPVLPEWVSETAQLSLLMPSRRTHSPAIQALRDFLVNNLCHYL